MSADHSNKTSTEASLACVSKLASPEAIALIGPYKRTALMSAFEARPQLPFATLLEWFAPYSDFNARDEDGVDIVGLALNLGDSACALELWRAHPDQGRAAKETTRNENTLAHIAAEHGALALLGELAAHVDFGARNARGHTPLMSVFDFSNRAAQATALLAPWSDCRSINPAGCDALMIAIETASEETPDRVDAVATLALRCDLSARDVLGESALDKAIHRGFSTIAAIIETHLARMREREALAQATSEPTTIGQRSRI